MPKNQPFWKIQNQTTNSKVGELYLYGDISSTESWWYDEITPKAFKSDLKNLGDVGEIIVHINSGGGDVFAANVIYNLLRDHGAKIVTVIDGLCASAATIIALAGDEIKMPRNSFFMIHNPAMALFGESEDLRKAAELLDKVKNTIMQNYIDKTGLSEEEVSQMMNDTTWLTAEEAHEKGFIDEIIDQQIEEITMKGNFVVMNSIKHDLSHLKNFPTNKIKNSAPKAPKGMEKMTPEEIKNKYPETFKEIANAAKQIERERISKIDNLALNGAEEIIQNAKDNGLSEAETAIQIINWQKENNAQQLQNMKEETSVMNTVQSGTVGIADIDEMEAILNRIEGVK